MIFSALVFSSKCNSEEVRHLSIHSQYVAFLPSARHGPNTVCRIGYPVLLSMFELHIDSRAAQSNTPFERSVGSMSSSWVNNHPSVVVTARVHSENGVNDLVVNLDSIAGL